MSETAEKATSMADEGEDHADKKKLSFDVDWGSLKDQIVGLLATAVKLICLVIALILVLRIVLTIVDANGGNSIVQMIYRWASNFLVGFKDMFKTHDTNSNVLLNYGVAAIFWVVVGIVGSAVIKKVGSLLG